MSSLPGDRPSSPAPVKAYPPHGHTSLASGSAELLFEGRCKHSAYLGSYLRAFLIALLAAGAAWGLTLVPALAAWPVWLLGLIGLPPLLAVFLRHRTTRYKISTRRIEFERGILTRTVDSLELWRVLDISYSQTLLDRMLGNAKIVLVGTDRSDPALVLHGLPDHRRLFESLRDAVQTARLSHRPMEFAGPDDLPMFEPR